jgi:hypothetical protein
VITEAQTQAPVNNNAGQAFGRGTQGRSNNPRVSTGLALSRHGTKWQPGIAGRIEIDNPCTWQQLSSIVIYWESM